MDVPQHIKEYQRLKRAFHRRTPANISERWISRVLANNYHQLGELGALAYLQRYGTNIGEDKAVHLAIKAEKEGFPELALGFWKKAYELSSTSGTKKQLSGSGNSFENEQTLPLEQIRETLTQRLNITELENICFDLGIDYEILSGQNKADKIRSLLKFCWQRQRLSELLDYIEKNRRDILLPSISAQ